MNNNYSNYNLDSNMNGGIPNLVHSSSMPSYLNNPSRNLFTGRRSRMLNRNNIDEFQRDKTLNYNSKVKLPLIKNYQPYNLTNSSKKFKRNNSDININEFSKYMNDINNNVDMKITNSNLRAQEQINIMKNNYNDMKNLFNYKLDKLEQDQQKQFENLKYFMELNAQNNPNNKNLMYAPKLLEDKIYQINNLKRQEYENQQRLLSEINKKVKEEVQKQKQIDEIKFQKQLNEIQQKRNNSHHYMPLQ